jgi:CheY-like chemotaxis protein
MREGYGSYIVRRLKQHSITTSIPIVVVTGRDLMYRPAREVDTGMERQFLRLGAQRVLMKPVDIEELLQCVRESVDWPIEAAGACAAR